ncbi:acetyl/propionyl/methylcrotonyl-CoA carboxylase subunit alpha [Hirschia baltica]|uniref:Carbamoyl-phosphate synthase L chain ATP-binding n=1 Tax=Hirschia baltica (strain ATCC 49814 / DSM 5838 / IFAM 1418) TaxID=582402 RepID=C6XJJ5_HIRBI|nr:acetyl/propionyl/methylcrotonyl-CoA carboxylase subunit alpha [Hirschia baltica]ACT59290.1 Carbamoyl-phosphate synthase L chain ATP-binding [Hirschia baltica ATCC 49814]
MIKKILIANRGEIACRIMRTAKEMNIATVAVYSDADAKALHTQMADEAIHIGPSPAIESYLVGEKIIAAAKKTGADAIHPGYGFLSENATFADAVIDAGLIWIGPKSSSIQAMGLKDAAKTLMEKAGIPCTPGYLGEDQSLKRLEKEAKIIGYPVLIKAVAGGGGKGMRKVDNASNFANALKSCQREAASSFGDDRVLLEKWITAPRHIEVQIFGDKHGNIVHLFERDCTLQRRHQKVIEEAPAFGMNQETRARICETAILAAQAVDYEGAGTIEFIADASGELNPDSIWFMEMNTRLQVEHPVTEAITGIDLVEWQIRIASGEPIPVKQEDISINGWAMEARLYSENPTNGFLPSIGKINLLNMPYGVRVDTGIQDGAEITPFYDPMVAKLIVHEENRKLAMHSLAEACENVSTYPVINNAGFLCNLLNHKAFEAGSYTTGFIDSNLEALTAKPPLKVDKLKAISLLLSDEDKAGPWNGLFGFRNGSQADLSMRISVDGETHTISVDPYCDDCPYWEQVSDGLLCIDQGWPYLVSLPRGKAKSGAGDLSDGQITSPMPGKILSLSVALGDEVTKGQPLITLEAMKMEHSMTAPFDGKVISVNVEADQNVMQGMILLEIVSHQDEEV